MGIRDLRGPGMPARAVGARARGLPMGTRDKWCADAGRARTDCSGRGAGMGIMILMRADLPAGAGHDLRALPTKCPQ